MAGLLISDPRIDPRIKAVFGDAPLTGSKSVASRAELLKQEHSEAGLAAMAQLQAMLEYMGGEEIVSSQGLDIRTHTITSHPDGNAINILMMRPAGSGVLPAVLYVHGGAMAVMSCYNANYQAWGRLIAKEGVAVAMVDFRNSLHPSSAPEVAQFPAGLNDCVSALHWLHDASAALQIDPRRIVVAGDSGGGNLALATAMRLQKDGAIEKLAGIYALCPFIAGEWPSPEYPSSTDNNGIFLNVHNNRYAMAYGISELHARNPLAWPGFAKEADVAGLPPTVISVNECDPLRDEGVAFYRLLLRAGVRARCTELKGTIHAIEIFPGICPDISRNSAAGIALFCQQGAAR